MPHCKFSLFLPREKNPPATHCHCLFSPACKGMGTGGLAFSFPFRTGGVYSLPTYFGRETLADGAPQPRH